MLTILFDVTEMSLLASRIWHALATACFADWNSAAVVLISYVMVTLTGILSALFTYVIMHAFWVHLPSPAPYACEQSL